MAPPCQSHHFCNPAKKGLNCVKDKIVLLLMDPKSKQLYGVWDVEARSIS